MRRKLILLGIDGGTWKIIKPLKEEGHLPTFQEIVDEGIHGTLTSTIPPNTLPAWTSIFTGTNPGKHGITNFTIRKDHTNFSVATLKDRMVDSIWRILSNLGLRSIIVNDPVTYPPEEINGIMTTGLCTPPGSQNFVHPRELKDELDRVTNRYECELPLDFSKIAATSKNKAYERLAEFANKIARASFYLAKNYEWDVLAIILTSIDRLQHFCWNDGHFIKDHYKWLDLIVREFLNIEPDANIVGVSDHGFGQLTKCFYVNNWLSALGLLKLKKSTISSLMSRSGLTYHKIAQVLLRIGMYQATAKLTPAWIKGRIPSSVFEKDALIDYANSSAYSVGFNGGIFINRKNNCENEGLKDMIFRNLRQVNDRGVFPVSNVYRNDEVLWGPYVHRGPDIFLLPHEGYEVSPRLSSFGIFGLPMARGTHRLEGIFIAYGPDIKKGYKLNFHFQTWDIAPTLLHTLGSPIPDYMDGKVLKEIFKEGTLPHIRPVKLQKYSELIPRKVAEVVYEPKGEEEIKERLRRLGYL